jgi:hypothetical protein
MRVAFTTLRANAATGSVGFVGSLALIAAPASLSAIL